MATEIRRVTDGRVIAVGGNASRDGERYLIAILIPYSGHRRTEDAVAELEAALEIWSEADPDYRPAQEGGKGTVGGAAGRVGGCPPLNASTASPALG